MLSLTMVQNEEDIIAKYDRVCTRRRHDIKCPQKLTVRKWITGSGRGRPGRENHVPSIAASSMSAKKPGAEPHRAVEASIA